MPLNATNFIVQGPIRSADMKQFVDLFTGVMVDQPVTFKNTFSAGGSQGTSTPPVKVYGVSSQTGSVLEVYPTTGSLNPALGVGPLGGHVWGPGGTAVVDTSMSRVALQNGHLTDTPGLLISPYLEVNGNIGANGFAFLSGAQITSPSPFILQVTGHLTFNPDNTYDIGQQFTNRPRNLYLAGAVGTKTKGGIPNDADFTNPVDGMLSVDTANHAFYFRSANTWRQVSGGAGGGTATTVEEEFVPAVGINAVTLAQTPTDVWVVSRNGLVQSEASGHYSWMSNSKTITFADPFTGTERLIVAYCIGSLASGLVGPTSSLHEEFKPANGATTVVVSQVPQVILIVSREGVVQSATDGNYSLGGNTLTFTDAFNGNERVVVEYNSTSFSPLITGNNIANSTIQNAHLAGYPWGNADLKADTARANLLTNGGFEIWQRGNGPFVSGAQSADRWGCETGGTDTISVSKDTTNVDVVSGSNAAATVTATKGSGAAGALKLTQNLKFGDGYQVSNRTFSLSVRVRTATPNAVRAALYDGSAFTYSAYHTGGSTWQTLTVTVNVNPGAALTQAAIAFEVSCTAYIDNAMLVVGNVAADYAPLHPADDLARCLRYYEVYSGGGVQYGICQAASATQAFGPMFYKVPKAVNPTITISAPGDFAITNAATTLLTCTNMLAQAGNTMCCQLYPQVASGLVAGNATYIQGNTANAKISVEANP